ncbi:MAG: SDR family NAD(P)-dependent oxidoreductase [Acidobacteriaceae bacterium]|jgi:UDP-glucose 4-epimerase|nr:SDR family NAD(P)-dependent oxidoreductase [Acidobacteriaceae bacterium]
MTHSTQAADRVVLVTGAAGFIGSQLVDVLLASGCSVIGVDDFSRGTEQNIARARKHSQFELHTIDLADETAVLSTLEPLLRGKQIAEVWHLAANSDIPAGVRDPRVDHRNTFMTTFNTLLLMRELKIPRIAFASTSAVYGENKELLRETTGPLLPISNYGAMKLAAEGLISAAVEAYLDQAHIFRFPNVLGPRLTHGIIYDFLNKLKRNPGELEVLGNGTQQKPYLHVKDLIQAMLFIREKANDRVNLFNIGPEDEGATVAEIAHAVLAGLQSDAPIRYTGGDRGWVGDVPRFRYSVDKLAKLGWRSSSSSLEVVRRTVAEALAPEELI